MKTQAFLKVSGINGTSVDRSHSHWIDIESFRVDENSSFRGSSNSSSGSSEGMRRIAESAFTKRVDATSAIFADAATKGTRFDEAILETVVINGNARQNNLRVRFKNVVVVSLKTRGKSASDFPIEETTIGFATRETGTF